MTNLKVISMVWLTSTFNFYLVSYLLKYFPGSVYTNSAISSISEIISLFMSARVYTYFGTRNCLIFFYSISTLGGVLILVYYFLNNTFKDELDCVR